MDQQVFHRGVSLAKGSESYNTCYGLRAIPSPSEGLVGRYSGLTLADLSAAVIARFHSKYERGPGCWLWTAGKYTSGYGQIALGRSSGHFRATYAHRVGYVLSHGPIPDGMVVRHTCDTPACVNPAHLKLGTQGDNNRDTVQRRRHVTARPWLRKLTDADVRTIRESTERGVRLAERFGVSKACISQLRNGLRRSAA
jgi:hypothetical protein